MKNYVKFLKVREEVVIVDKDLAVLRTSVNANLIN